MNCSRTGGQQIHNIVSPSRVPGHLGLISWVIVEQGMQTMLAEILVAQMLHDL